MDFYTFAMKASGYCYAAVGGFAVATVLAYGKGRWYGRRREVAKYRGLPLEDWRQLALSNDEATRVQGYDGLYKLRDVEGLRVFFDIERDDWNRFCLAYSLSKLEASTPAISAYVLEFLFRTYGLCSLEEWERMEAEGGLKPLFDRSRYQRVGTRGGINRTTGTEGK